MIIQGKNFFKNNINKRKYLIHVSNSEKKIEDMINYFNYYLNLDDNLIIGIDFEFNRSLDNTMREIALCQINLEFDFETNKETKIYLFYPPDLNKDQTNVLIKLLTTNKIKKILHGGESLDIPYLFKNLIVTSENQRDFCKNLFDTKYLCEFYNLKNKKEEFKCKIYSLLIQMEVIDETQLKYLEDNSEKMGPIYNIRINVNELSEELINYSAYDVLYLPQLYKAFPDTFYYQKIIPELTSVHFILKQNDFFKNHLEHFAKFNNYYLEVENDKFNLINMYDFMFNFIKYNDMDHILEITYFKKYFQIILKSIVYYYLNKYYTVYQKKDMVNDLKPIKIDKILKLTKNFKHISKLLKKLKINIKREIKRI